MAEAPYDIGQAWGNRVEPFGRVAIGRRDRESCIGATLAATLDVEVE
jgi:hypothetical protein